MRCPSCAADLTAKKVEGTVDVHACACGGTLVAVNRLVPLLDVLGGAMRHAIGPDEPIEPVPAAAGRRACPRCRRPMEPFGYMGTTLVTLDRCNDDALLWIDADEIGALALLYLRTNKRTAARDKQHQQLREGLERSTRLTLSARIRANRIATGLILGGSALF